VRYAELVKLMISVTYLNKNILKEPNIDRLILENTFYSDFEKISFDLKIDLPKFNKSKLFTEL